MKTLLSLLFMTFSLVSCEHLSQEEVTQQFGSERGGSMFLQFEGKAIHYRTSGNENGPVILMLPGMGLSDGLDWDNDRFIDQLNKCLVKFMGALQINDFHVLGHSFGGLLAWTMAFAYPENVDKVALIFGDRDQ